MVEESDKPFPRLIDEQNENVEEVKPIAPPSYLGSRLYIEEIRKRKAKSDAFIEGEFARFPKIKK